MLHADYDEKFFYIFAMKLFNSAGHVFTLSPEFINHSPKRFVYFDNRTDITFSRTQRDLFQSFNNISRLFSVNNCIFFSMNLITAKNNRSQAAYDIHTLIHSLTESEGTICLFRYENKIMLSLAGFGYSCILSDWYPIEDDYDNLLKRLDISNMSISSDEEYFNDMIYSLARDYYLHAKPTTYALLPVDFKMSSADIDSERIDEQINFELTAPQRNYGNDYVEYDESVSSNAEDMNTKFSLLLLELENENDSDEKLEFENEELDKDDLFETEEKDIYELDDVDSEIFQDPVLMVKWLEKGSEK